VGLEPCAGLVNYSRPRRTDLAYDFLETHKPLAMHSVLKVSGVYKLKVWGSLKLISRTIEETIEKLVRQLYYRVHTLEGDG